MLVILTDHQVIAPKQVCHDCLLADQKGQPRWQQGRLSCGHAVHKQDDQEPEQYECEMGFRLANLA